MPFAGLSEQESVVWADYLHGLEWHLDPLDMNTFNGLIQSYKDNRIDSTQLYTLVYAMFHAISALHLFPMFKAFTPWRDQDTTWFDSRTRRALCDDNLWNQICVQVKLSPKQTLTALVRHPDGSIRHKEVSCTAPSAIFFPKFPLRMSGIPVAVSAAAAKGTAEKTAAVTTTTNTGSTSIEQHTSPSRVVKLKLAKEHLQSSSPAIKSNRPIRIVKLKTGKSLSLPKIKQRCNKHVALIAASSLAATPNNFPIPHPNLSLSNKRTYKPRPPPLKIIPSPPCEGPPFSPLTPQSPRTPPTSPLTPPPALSFPVTSMRQASSPVSAIQSEVFDVRAWQTHSCTSAEMEGLGGEDAMIGDEIVEMDLGEMFDGEVFVDEVFDGRVDGVGEGEVMVQQMHGEVSMDAGAMEIDGVAEDGIKDGEKVFMTSGEMEIAAGGGDVAIEDDEEDAEFELEEW